MDIRQIQHLSHHREEHHVKRFLTQDELASLRIDLQNEELARDQKEKEKQAVLDTYKGEFGELNKKRAVILQKLQTHYQNETFDCYLVANWETDKMEYYDAITGELRDSRDLKGSEKNTPTIFNNPES